MTMGRRGWFFAVLAAVTAIILSLAGCYKNATTFAKVVSAPRGATMCVNGPRFQKGLYQIEYNAPNAMQTKRYSGYFPCEDCGESGLRAVRDEFTARGFEVREVSSDEEAAAGGCDVYFSAEPVFIINASQGFSTAGPITNGTAIFRHILVADVRNGKKVLFDNEYIKRKIWTKGQIQGIHKGKLDGAKSPEGQKVLAKVVYDAMRLITFDFSKQIDKRLK